MSEHSEQVTVFQWAALQSRAVPELALLYAVPNQGRRPGKEGANKRAEGMKAGVPDICLPVARHNYHGIYIELKVGRNEPTELQKWWLDRLGEQGYLAVACWGADETIETLSEYLGLDL